MSNDDGVVTNQDIFDQQAHDPLLFLDIERFGRGPQAGEEARECFGEPKVGGTLLLLFDRRRYGRASPYCDDFQYCVRFA